MKREEAIDQNVFILVMLAQLTISLKLKGSSGLPKMTKIFSRLVLRMLCGNGI